MWPRVVTRSKRQGKKKKKRHLLHPEHVEELSFGLISTGLGCTRHAINKVTYTPGQGKEYISVVSGIFM